MGSASALAAVELAAVTEAPEQPAGEVAVRFTDVSKTFRVPVNRAHTLKERVLRPRTSREAHHIEALKQVSFEIGQGEFFGIIGRNGSGKSTLLKCLAGIYQPTSGKIEVAGRVSPFLELGVGFSPELTARENIVLNASLIGISPKKARESVDEVIAFAELEEFVELKHKNYSSGMAMRLAFAAAIQAEADILLVDEALAVGDDPFKEKCYERFDQMKLEGRTIVFVSHALSLVNRFCDRALLLDHGEIIQVGEPRPTVALYQERNRKRAQAAETTTDDAATDKAAIVAADTQPLVDQSNGTITAPVVEAEPAKPAPPPPAPQVAPVFEPATEPDVSAPPAAPEAAILGALWIADARRAGPRPVPQSIQAGTLHVRTSFPDALKEPIFGVIAKDGDGDTVDLVYTLQADLTPGAPPRHPHEPYSIRFYVHSGQVLYVASVAIRDQAESPDEDPTSHELSFSVYGMRLGGDWGQGAAAFGLPEPSRSAGLVLSGPGVPWTGEAWLQNVDGQRDEVFVQGHAATLHAELVLPGETVAGASDASAPGPSAYTLSLYAYSDAGHYLTSVALIDRLATP